MGGGSIRLGYPYLVPTGRWFTWTMLRLERPMEALYAYTQALEHDPALMVAYVGKAMALLELGQQEEAGVALRRAFELYQEQSE